MQRRDMTKYILPLLCLFFCCWSGQALAWQGTVLSVQDGDTLTIAPSGDARTPVTVRLYGIDAPEYDQSGGSEATDYLKQLCPISKKVSVIAYSTDKYGRTVALVVSKRKVLNADMLEQGHAWVYARYCKQKFCRTWRKLEKNAKAHDKGLWRDNAAVPPWEWRRREVNLK